MTREENILSELNRLEQRIKRQISKNTDYTFIEAQIYGMIRMAELLGYRVEVEEAEQCEGKWIYKYTAIKDIR